jgi:hypothetical protein
MRSGRFHNTRDVIKVQGHAVGSADETDLDKRHRLGNELADHFCKRGAKLHPITEAGRAEVYDAVNKVTDLCRFAAKAITKWFERPKLAQPPRVRHDRIAPPPRALPLDGHDWAPSPFGARCHLCCKAVYGTKAETDKRIHKLRFQKCLGDRAINRARDPDLGHVLRLAYIPKSHRIAYWCTLCGAHAMVKPVLLLGKCKGPDKGRVGPGRTALKSLACNRYPSSGPTVLTFVKSAILSCLAQSLGPATSAEAFRHPAADPPASYCFGSEVRQDFKEESQGPGSSGSQVETGQVVKLLEMPLEVLEVKGSTLRP